MNFLAATLCGLALLVGCGDQAAKSEAKTKKAEKPLASYTWKLAH